MKVDQILLSHGGGGEEMNQLINNLVFKIFDNETLRLANDSAILDIKNTSKIAFSTDSFVVSPLFFSGGNIGKIAVCGTINDLSMVGAEAKYLSCSLIIEEGFSIKELETILETMAKEAKDNGVEIVCGDTKVVPKGKADGLFINTSGIGIIIKQAQTKNLKVGDKILLSGDIGRHGSVILAKRDELELESNLISDCKSLKKVVLKLLGEGITPICMRDATRGGLSAVLNEWSSQNKLEILVFEEKVKVCDEVVGICELLGFEPYELANEGTFIIAVEPKDEEKALFILKNFDKNANVIGEVVSKDKSYVKIQNAYGSQRILEAPRGELLPRIC